MTEWFTLYGEPVAYDFANRFRTGEMPIAIASYTIYNQLRVFAPEIAGLWEFVQLPGVEREDGTINHASPAAPHAMMMMKDAADDITDGQDITESKKAQNAWKYLQWWVSYETQARFGQEQVAIMGTAAKYHTANIQALTSQSWTAQEKRNLLQQFRSLKGTPMSPGNYIVARYTNFAFYAVVDDGEVASEAMLGYVDDINHELSRKRDEYGFLTMEEYMEELAAKGKAA
jgi:membrane-bound lytic murein transglycosylase